MKRLLILQLLTTVLSANHNLVQKSVHRANYECRQYLRESPKCEARCQQIVLRAWDDHSGLDPVPYGSHFQPDYDDQLYENRTAQCARELSQRDDSCCRKSDIAWRCYRDQYGELLGTPQIVPMPDLLLHSTVEDCARILQISDHQIADVNLNLTAAGRRLLRCVIIREGFYSDGGGPNLDHLYVQCGGYQLGKEAFKSQFQSCLAELLLEQPDSSTLAARLVSECIPRSSFKQRFVLPSGNVSAQLPAGTSPASCRTTQLVSCATTCNNPAIARQCASTPIIGPAVVLLVLASFPLVDGFPLTGPLIQTLPSEVRACIVAQFTFCRANCLPDVINANCQAVVG